MMVGRAQPRGWRPLLLIPDRNPESRERRNAGRPAQQTNRSGRPGIGRREVSVTLTVEAAPPRHGARGTCARNGFSRIARIRPDGPGEPPRRATYLR